MKFRHVGRFYAKARGPPLSVCSGPPVKQHGRILRGGGFRTTVLQGGEALIRNTVHSQRPSCETARKEFTGVSFRTTQYCRKKQHSSVGARSACQCTTTKDIVEYHEISSCGQILREELGDEGPLRHANNGPHMLNIVPNRV